MRIHIMETKEINKTKILVKVHEPLIAIMQHKMEAACLKRDAYLDKALRVEAEFLRREIATPNSDKAKNYIAAQLGDLKLKPLNLLLSTETVDLINEVCKEKNVPRDAFMNRFFLLLIANDTILTALFKKFLQEADIDQSMLGFIENFSPLEVMDFFPRYDLEDFFYYGSVHIRNSNALDTIEEIVSKFSPFMLVRGSIMYIGEMCNANGVVMRNYSSATYVFPFAKKALQKLPEHYENFEVDNALGFNTFMSDEQVATQQELDTSLQKEINEKSKTDKLLAVMLKEKQVKAEKAKQASLAKAKSAGDAK